MTEPVTTAFVAVGSNLEPQRHLSRAIDRLQQHVRVAAVSTVYRTDPLDRPEQPPFLNAVWQIETSMEARALKFDVLRAIEAELGRVRTDDRYAARTIDLDVILCGRAVIDAPDLQIPDPDIRRRPFIAIPLLELAPDLVLPDTGEPLAAIAAGLDASGLEPRVELTAGLRDRLA